MHTDSIATVLETVPAPTRDAAASRPSQPETRPGPIDPPGPAADSDFELVQRTVAELDDAATERQRATGTYREALAALEAAADDKAEAEAVEADTRANLLALCGDLVREHAEPDARLTRHALCERTPSGQRLALHAGSNEAALGRMRDGILDAEPGRELYVVREEYVRVATTVRHPQTSG